MTTTSAIVNRAAYMEDQHFIRWAFGGQRLLWGDYVQVEKTHCLHWQNICIFIFSYLYFHLYLCLCLCMYLYLYSIPILYLYLYLQWCITDHPVAVISAQAFPPCCCQLAGSSFWICFYKINTIGDVLKGKKCRMVLKRKDHEKWR